jgi:ferredoxin
MVTSMRFTVDRDRCIGAGNCVMNAPDLFDQDDDGLVVLLPPAAGGEIPDEHADTGGWAVASCPSGALRRVAERAG